MANDLLFMRMSAGPDGNSPVAWSRLSPVIDVAEQLMARVALQLIHQWSGPSGNQVSSPLLCIAGPPRPGSIVLPFVIEIPRLLDFTLVAASQHPGSATGVMAEALGSLADAAALALFVRDVVFGPRGIIAKRTDQAVPGAPTTIQESAIDTLTMQIDSYAQLVDQLMQSAARTGCDELDFQINDGPAIKLIMAGHRKRSSLLARRPPMPQPAGLPAGYEFDLDQPGSLQRNGDYSLRVVVGGTEHQAFLFGNISPMRQFIVGIWASSGEPPKDGETVDVQGRRLTPSEVEVLDDVDPNFEASIGIFLIERSRPTWR